ncbi:site-specific integrase, partial [Pseudomonas sp. NPDC079086]|uniref:site-specific integrase n=1 Tax=unclassified Pseudomonas TaxID=196821 RepID=UPI0037C629BB
AMLPITLKKYQIRARNFYRTYCGKDDPTSAQICAAILARAQELQPNSFSTLKSALLNDQISRSNHGAAQAIRQIVNPVTAPNSELARKPKPSKVRAVSHADFKSLYKHLKDLGYIEEAASLILAHCLGVRPCEMRTITVVDSYVSIIGGKKNASLHRGADRTLIIESPKVLHRVKQAASWMSNCPRTNTAIRDRLRKECRTLWPRRKQHPTLKSFRHQVGSNLKASGESAEAIAYIMGHQSTGSISIYGNRRSGEGRKLYIKAAESGDLSKVRKPEKAPRYGREKVIGKVEFPAATRGPWFHEMKPRREAKMRDR